MGEYRPEPKDLGQRVSAWLSDPALIEMMSANSKRAARPTASLDIAREILEVMTEHARPLEDGEAGKFSPLPAPSPAVTSPLVPEQEVAGRLESPFPTGDEPPEEGKFICWDFCFEIALVGCGNPFGPCKNSTLKILLDCFFGRVLFLGTCQRIELSPLGLESLLHSSSFCTRLKYHPDPYLNPNTTRQAKAQTRRLKKAEAGRVKKRRTRAAREMRASHPKVQAQR